MTARPWQVSHPDEVVLSVLRCKTRADALEIGATLGIHNTTIDGWFYRKQWRAVRLAALHKIPSPPAQKLRGERATIRAIMAGDA